MTTEQTNWIVPILEDSDGELLFTLPDEMLDSLDWTPGDTLIWKQESETVWSITKLRELSEDEVNQMKEQE